MLHGDAEGGYRGHPYKAIRADKHLMGAKCPGSTMKQGSVRLQPDNLPASAA